MLSWLKLILLILKSFLRSFCEKINKSCVSIILFKTTVQFRQNMVSISYLISSGNASFII